jgi:hypothetical protein
MKRFLSAVILATGLAGLGGCCAPGEIPVSLEGPCNLMRFHGPDCCEYPYSSPPCPYWDDCSGTWQNQYGGPPSGNLPPPAPVALRPDTAKAAE